MEDDFEFPADSTQGQRTQAEEKAWQFISDPQRFAVGEYRPHLIPLLAYSKAVHIMGHLGVPCVKIGNSEMLVTPETLVELFDSSKAAEHAAGLTFENGNLVGADVQKWVDFVEKHQAAPNHSTPRFTRFLSLFGIREALHRRLSKTLAKAMGTGASPPTTSVTVSSSKSGLSVEWTFAYLGHYTYMGHPSSPVSGQLKPAYYRFAGRPSGGILIMDPAVFDISATPKCRVTYF